MPLAMLAEVGAMGGSSMTGVGRKAGFKLVEMTMKARFQQSGVTSSSSI